MAGKPVKKIKIKPAPVIATAAVLVMLLGLVIYAAVNGTKKDEDAGVNVSLNQTNLKQTETVPENDTQRVSATVEIQAEDAAVPVGTQFKVTALVTPQDTEQALVWISGDTGIFEVDAQGVVTVKGIGTAVLTATVGTVTDAIVIEGIAAVADGSKNNFPVYTGGGSGGGTAAANAGGNVTPGDSHASGGSIGNNVSGDNNNAGTGSSGSDNTNIAGGNTGTNHNEAGGNPGGSEDTGEEGTASGGNGNGGSTQGGSTGGNEASGGGQNNHTNTEFGNTLPQMGFSQVLSNVYVCQEDDTYYGEIITQPNVTIVYIKRRSAAFDARIQSVLASILPHEHAQVWNNYLTANTDRTFTVEDRKVRIVVASNGGHSQIVIYN